MSSCARDAFYVAGPEWSGAGVQPSEKPVPIHLELPLAQRTRRTHHAQLCRPEGP
jgi:hypothetical protein